MKPEEGILEFIQRCQSSNIVRDFKCMGFINCTPEVMNLVNEPIKTHEHTYYFAFSSGDRMRSRAK